MLLDGRRANRALPEVFLRPTDRFLTLSIRTDRNEYPPGGKCTVAVTALNHRGQPVPGADIGLDVVGEAIYETAVDPTPDLFDFFH